MTEMRIVSWNVNGVRSIARKGFLSWLQAETPDMLCLQETRAGVAKFPEELREVAGYHLFCDAGARPGYSGVALYSRTAPREVRFGIGRDEFDCEGRILLAEYPWFTLCNIYFPNGKSSPARLHYKLDFYEAFLEYIDHVRAGGQHVVVCGDLNTAHREIDLARPKQNMDVSGFLPEERAWIDRLLAHGYVDTFRMFCSDGGHYSWWDYKTRARDRNVGWRLDYFFVDADLAPRVHAATIHADVPGSDHCPVSLDLTR